MSLRDPPMDERRKDILQGSIVTQTV